MRRALEGLPGVEKVDMHIRHDLFVVSLAAGSETGEDDLLRTVRDLQYEARIVNKEEVLAEGPATGVPREIPDYVQRVLDEARREGKLIIFDCYAEWCAPCKRMLTETLADPRVKAVVKDRCVLVKVDVEKTPEIAEYFETAGVPDI